MRKSEAGCLENRNDRLFIGRGVGGVKKAQEGLAASCAFCVVNALFAKNPAILLFSNKLSASGVKYTAAAIESRRLTYPAERRRLTKDAPRMRCGELAAEPGFAVQKSPRFRSGFE